MGDNAKYDKWYRGQVEELLSNYGKVDVMWFDHVGGQDWGKWKFDELFAMMYRLQPGLIVNNRPARFCGPRYPARSRSGHARDQQNDGGRFRHARNSPSGIST